MKTPKHNDIYSQKKIPPGNSKIQISGKIGKFESGSSTENFTNIYQNNLTKITTTTTVFEELNDDEIEKIVREGEEIDESIERLEKSIKKLRGSSLDEEEEEKEDKTIVKAKVPKLNFKRLKSNKKRKKKRRTTGNYQQYGLGKYK